MCFYHDFYGFIIFMAYLRLMYNEEECQTICYCPKSLVTSLWNVLENLMKLSVAGSETANRGVRKNFAIFTGKNRCCGVPNASAFVWNLRALILKKIFERLCLFYESLCARFLHFCRHFKATLKFLEQFCFVKNNFV